MSQRSLGAEYFDPIYAANPDPWQFATSEYEREKYLATVQALGSQRFRRGFEIGCSIGVLTALLSQRCDELLAVDVSESALQSARLRCADRPNVTFARMAVPHEFPTCQFDLIVLSEVGYYWSPDDLQSSIEKIAGAARGGTVELVHYLPQVPEYPQNGDRVHRAFLADRRFTLRHGCRTDRYRLDVLTL